ncbi:MAG: hypothetical protein COS68_01560 [Elusimicrobia bacterium CG06_land_8_20_14_3_00_38_11]|nr:MAG: hypothetical protein COS68_01560 [Elusimicrobia bacterium CG06_land_8_20_14_3_00_38_11]
MNTLTKNQIRVPAGELSKILKAYNTIGDFLETFLDRRTLYKKEFSNGLTIAIKEVAHRKTKTVENFSDFIF